MCGIKLDAVQDTSATDHPNSDARVRPEGDRQVFWHPPNRIVLQLDASSAPKEQAQNPASVPPPRTAPFSELFQGFPSTLFQGSNYRREFGASFDLPDLSGTAPRLQQQLSNPPPAQNRQNANNGHQKEQTPFGWPLESPTPSPAVRLYHFPGISMFFHCLYCEVV